MGATDSTDQRASFSNLGSCLDLFAPGVNIRSTWNASNSATMSLSGTSVATPHATGPVALFRETHPTAAPAQAQYAVVGTASNHAVLNAGRLSPDGLLYTGFFGSGPGNLPPLATFDFSCTTLACGFNSQGSVDDQGTTSRTWTFGDGTSGSGNQPPHAYAVAGSYSITLRVTDAQGLSATLAKSFTLPAAGGRAGLPPAAAVTAFPHGAVDFDGSPSTDDVGIGS